MRTTADHQVRVVEALEHVPLAADARAKLETLAQASGADVEQVAGWLLERTLRGARLSPATLDALQAATA